MKKGVEKEEDHKIRTGWYFQYICETAREKTLRQRRESLMARYRAIGLWHGKQRPCHLFSVIPT